MNILKIISKRDCFLQFFWVVVGVNVGEEEERRVVMWIEIKILNVEVNRCWSKRFIWRLHFIRIWHVQVVLNVNMPKFGCERFFSILFIFASTTLWRSECDNFMNTLLVYAHNNNVNRRKMSLMLPSSQGAFNATLLNWLVQIPINMECSISRAFQLIEDLELSKRLWTSRVL